MCPFLVSVAFYKGIGNRKFRPFHPLSGRLSEFNGSTYMVSPFVSLTILLDTH